VASDYLITNHIVLPLHMRPISYYWCQWCGAQSEVLVDEAKLNDSEMTSKPQLTARQFCLGVGIINLFGDISILAVLISSVLKLHMQMVAICFMFLLGSLCAPLALLR